MTSPAMKALKQYGERPRWKRRVLVGLGVVVLIAVAAGVAYTVGKKSTPSTAGGAAASTTTAPARDVAHLALISTTPAANASNVASNATITLRFTTPVTLGSGQPTLTPAVAGTWAQVTPTMLRYDLTAPLIPFTHEVVTVPGGVHGLRGRNGSDLPTAVTIPFTVADGSFQRLKQLLAELDYLPLSFAPSGPTAAAADQAEPQPGTLAWRWSTLPTDLTAQWSPLYEDVITKGAVMTFENQNDLTVDGLAGPTVWSDLLRDVAAQKVDTAPYTYVEVSKTLPENLTLYNNGAAQYTNIPVNTGAPGADTVDGTYPVFEHVTSSRMVGTNPDGSHYDDPDVPWASYFNGGDALHGFVRASYGSPQSNGCVEMAIANAQTLWPLTPIGTLVTVVGPPVT